jgi:hypothetical protein
MWKVEPACHCSQSLFGAANFGYFALRGVGRRLLGLEPALAIRFDSNFFARSNSARRLRLSPLPARLMKYVSIFIPEIGPFGDTLRDANARAIVLASFANSPACGCVESVLTFATQRLSAARVLPREPAFRRLRIYILTPRYVRRTLPLPRRLKSLVPHTFSENRAVAVRAHHACALSDESRVGRTVTISRW